MQQDYAKATASDELTPRQRQVVPLIAQGLSNRQIARTLRIADGTATRHVADILAKLGFQSRAQIASWAVEQGYVGTPRCSGDLHHSIQARRGEPS